MQEMHFKPTCQARRQTFASDKTKPVKAEATGRVKAYDDKKAGYGFAEEIRGRKREIEKRGTETDRTGRQRLKKEE